MINKLFKKEDGLSMRNRIKVVGLGQRRAGTSTKNGKAYDFIPVAFVYSNQYFDGLCAATCNIQGSDADAAGLKVGSEVEAFMHYQDNKPVIDGLVI